MIGSMRTSGHVVLSAAAVMVAVILAWPCPATDPWGWRSCWPSPWPSTPWSYAWSCFQSSAPGNAPGLAQPKWLGRILPTVGTPTDRETRVSNFEQHSIGGGKVQLPDEVVDDLRLRGKRAGGG